MVKQMISSKDLEKLSAYIDGQLQSSEREQLQKRLRHDKALQESLTNLQQTRAVIRSLPKRKAPRNFTLTANMVSVERTPFFRPAFGLVSALAVLFLFFVLISDYLFIPEYIGMFPVSKAPSEINEIAAMEKVAESEPLIFPSEIPAAAVEESLEMPVEEPVGIGGGAEPAGQEDPALETLMGTPEPPMMEAAPSAADELPLSEGTRLLDEESDSLPEEAATEMLEELDVQTPSALKLEGNEDAEPIVEPSLMIENEPFQSVLWVQWILWLVEVILLIIAVGSGILMVYMRLRKRF